MLTGVDIIGGVCGDIGTSDDIVDTSDALTWDLQGIDPKV